MTENKALAVSEEKVETVAIQGFISQAIEKGTPVETMEKLFALREKAKAEYAREEFMKAMASFQRDCPVIVKKKIVTEKGGVGVRYKYAPLDDIVSQVKKPLADNLLSYDFDTVEDQEKKTLEVICVITHALGHSKSSKFKIPIGAEAYMSDVQKYGARVTFAKRYAFCNALGILTGDEDTDAGDKDKKDVKPLNTKAQIVGQLKELGENTSKEKIGETIKRLTGLEAVGDEEHLKEIVSRLDVIISERKENEG
jgi:hypothetical protein